MCKLDVLFLYAFVLCFTVDGNLLPKHVGQSMYKDNLRLYINCIHLLMCDDEVGSSFVRSFVLSFVN
jgi:hypothetical protein